MNRSKKLVTKIVKYLRELSIIITGIVITVGFGLWMNQNNTRKDQKQYISAIILELKENAENFDAYARMLQKCVRYSNYINSHDVKSISQDSIYYYAFGDENSIGWGNTPPVILYTDDAFEMYKSSGVMRLMDDKELLLSIWKVYQLMKNTQSRIDDHLRYKRELSMDFRQRTDNGEDVVVPISWFYMNNVPLMMVRDCEDASSFIRETISKLEQSKIVR